MRFISLWLFSALLAGAAHAASFNKVDLSDPNIWQEKMAPVRILTEPTCTTLSTVEHCYSQDPASMTDIQHESLRRLDKREANGWEKTIKK